MRETQSNQEKRAIDVEESERMRESTREREKDKDINHSILLNKFT